MEWVCHLREEEEGNGATDTRTLLLWSSDTLLDFYAKIDSIVTQFPVVQIVY